MGLSLLFVIDASLYQLVAFMAYLGILAFVPHYRREAQMSFKEILFCFVAPLVIGFLLFYSCLGNQLFSEVFLSNFVEKSKEFLAGLDALPFYESLERRYYFSFVLGLALPVVYILTMLFVGTLWCLRRISKDNIFVVILCVYGLALYHYYVCRSDQAYLYAILIPFIFVCCYWLNILSGRWRLLKENGICVLLACLVVLLFFTNSTFISYPNFIHGITFDNNELQTLNKYYDFECDAQFIKRLTREEEKIPLISNFETAILMKADRKPFFYYFPVIRSRMNEKEFGGTNLITLNRLNRSLDQLEKEKPRIVFIEARLFYGKIHPVYFVNFKSLTILIQYLSDFYAPIHTNGRLVACKRKAG